MYSPHSRPPHTQPLNSYPPAFQLIIPPKQHTPAPPLLPSNLSTHPSSETTHSNPSTYISSYLPTFIFYLFLFSNSKTCFFYNFSSPLPDTSPLLFGCCISNLIVLIFMYLGLHRMASEIQLLLLKNTAAPPQEYSCSSSRISRLRDRGNIDLLLSRVLGIQIRPGLFCWFKNIS
jgi:hypothetical protein